MREDKLTVYKGPQMEIYFNSVEKETNIIWFFKSIGKGLILWEHLEYFVKKILDFEDDIFENNEIQELIFDFITKFLMEWKIFYLSYNFLIKK